MFFVVFIFDVGVGVGYIGICIWGIDFICINVIVNGIFINDVELQGVFWVNMLDFVSFVFDIQIQWGVGMFINGVGVFGVMININIIELKFEVYVMLNGFVGFFNMQWANVEFGFGLFNGKFIFDGCLFSIILDGFIDWVFFDFFFYYFLVAYLGESSSLCFVIFFGQEWIYQVWYGVFKDFLEVDSLCIFNFFGIEKEGEFYENEVDNYGQDYYQLIYNN